MLMAHGLWLMVKSPLPRSGIRVHSWYKHLRSELPHDVIFTCAKRDKPPSRRRPSRVINSQDSPSDNNVFRTMADVCEAFCVICVICGLIKFVFIRVYSWYKLLRSELPHDVVSLARSVTNRRAAGAVRFFHDWIFVLPIKSFVC